MSDVAAHEPQAPDTPSSRVPASWRGSLSSVVSEGRRWTMIEITMLSFNLVMLAWFLAVIVTFGDRADQTDPVGTLIQVLAVWVVGTVGLFFAMSWFVRRPRAVAAGSVAHQV